MGAVREGNGARTVFALLPLDLIGDELDRLRPGDATVAGLAAVLRIARAVRIEVDPLHRIQQAVGRIDHRLDVLAVRRQRGLARRRQFLALGLNGPRRAILFGQIDRRHAHDLAVAHVDEHRAAVGHVAISRHAAGRPGAVLEARRLRRHQRLREPVGQSLFALDGEQKILLSVDLVEPVDRRHEQRGAGRGILEHQLDVGLFVQPGPRSDLAVAQFDPAADPLVARHDLGDQIVLAQARLEGRITPGRDLEELCRTEQDDGKFHLGERHGFLLIFAAPARGRAPRGARHVP